MDKTAAANTINAISAEALANPNRKYVIIMDHIQDDFTTVLYKPVTIASNTSSLFSQTEPPPNILDSNGNVTTTYFPVNLSLVAIEDRSFMDVRGEFENEFFDRKPTGWDNAFSDEGFIGLKMYDIFLED